MNEYITKGLSEGIISGSDIANRLSNKSVLIESLKYQMTQIKDQATRDQYEMTINAIRKVQEGESIKAIPKSIRDDYLIGLYNRNLLNQ